MSMRIVKIGDRFKLGPWEWKVINTDKCFFQAERLPTPVCECGTAGRVYFVLADADQLEWIKPEPTILEEAANELHRWLDALPMTRWTIESLKDKISSMVEKK